MDRQSTPLVDPSSPVFRAHLGGKLATLATQPLRDAADLSLLYTPGVAEVSRAIAADPKLAGTYTSIRNTVAVISDGTAVLGLGNIGPLAAMPVMEGKAVLFKRFGGVDAVPLCMETGTVDELVDAIARVAPTYGGINLEDISAPRCFEIERRLQERLEIPVFHDDQHGTAIVVLAALVNAARVVGRDLATLDVVVSGAGAAGVAVTKILLLAGVGHVVVVDSAGTLHTGRAPLPPHKQELAALTNRRGVAGGIAEALVGADVLVGVSGGTIPESALARMAPDAMIFALANPDPEVHPTVAHRYARVVATGRSDFPNQINNVLAFPGDLPRRPGLWRPPGDRGDEARRRIRDRRPRRAPDRRRGGPERLPPGGRTRGGGGGASGRLSGSCLLEEALAHALGHRGGAVRDAELLVEPRRVGLHGAGPEEQLPAQLGDRQPTGETAEHLELARAEHRAVRLGPHPDLVDQPAGQLRGHDGAALAHRDDGLDDLLPAGVLGEVPRGTGLHRRVHDAALDQRRQHEDLRRQPVPHDGGEDLEPVEVGHLVVDHRDVRRQLGR